MTCMPLNLKWLEEIKSCRSGFWKENTLVQVPLFRCLLVAGFPSTFITGLSRLLSVVSFKPGLVSVSGCPASLVRTLDNCGLFSRGVQYPFRFDVLSLQTLMHRGGRRRLRANGFLLATAIFDCVPQWHFNRALGAGITRTDKGGLSFFSIQLPPFTRSL